MRIPTALRSRSRGEALPSCVRVQMERAFQQDFSAVRIHEDGMARQWGARAFACGHDIHFAPGCFRPEHPAGKWLLAHELAHVVQQRERRAANPFGHGVAMLADPHLEAEADVWATLAVRGQCVPVHTGVQGAMKAPARLLSEEFQPGEPLVVQCDDEDDDDDEGGLPVGKWPNIRSRHTSAKKVGKGLMTAGSIGVQAASISTGASAIALMTGAAVSATGIGLIATGAAIAVGTSVLAAKSAHKTHKHIKLLETIYERRQLACQDCRILQDQSGAVRDYLASFGNIHEFVADTVLPWIIRQKKHKLGKKVGTVVGGGVLVGIWSAGRNLYKRAKGTLGKRRSYYAEGLAVHLITSTCPLAMAIVAELLSLEDMVALRGMSSEEAAPHIAEKMKSI